jgi:hypothetical protein
VVPEHAQTFLYGARKALLLLHFVGAVVLAGSSVHLALRMPAMLRGRSNPRLERIYGRVVAVSYGLTYLLGAVLYPTYRIHVRAVFLDRHHPMVSNLFDVKENLATIALPLALGALGGRLSDDADRRLRPIFASMSAFVAAVVVFDVLSGVYIASVRAV